MGLGVALGHGPGVALGSRSGAKGGKVPPTAASPSGPGCTWDELLHGSGGVLQGMTLRRSWELGRSKALFPSTATGV